MSYSRTRAEDTSRRVIDVAIGILVGLRGCSEREAFDELVRAVHQTGIGIGSLASGLVALATGSSSASHAEAFTVWDEVIRRGRLATISSGEARLTQKYPLPGSRVPRTW